MKVIRRRSCSHWQGRLPWHAGIRWRTNAPEADCTPSRWSAPAWCGGVTVPTAWCPPTPADTEPASTAHQQRPTASTFHTHFWPNKSRKTTKEARTSPQSASQNQTSMGHKFSKVPNEATSGKLEWGSRSHYIHLFIG